MAKQRELTNFPWNALSAELQIILLRSFNLTTLGRACRLNKAISAQATRIFWTSIDLKDRVDPICHDCGRWWCSRADDGRWQLKEMLQKFFLTSHGLQQTRTTRWKELAAHVTYLRLVKVPGIRIGEWLTHFVTYLPVEILRPFRQDFDYSAEQPTIWDVICDFGSLEELELYSEHSWQDQLRAEDLAPKMQGALPRLGKLKIGGDMSKELMMALLLTAHDTLEELSCIALLDGTVGQDYYSRGLLHLAEASSEKPFPKLKSLHLFKLAELTEFPPPTEEEEHPTNDESGVPWPLEESDDRGSLQDWATFIGRVSDNLESLTLEDCYLVGNPIKDRARLINPGNAYPEPRLPLREGTPDSGDNSSSPETEQPDGMDPVNWGAGSRRRFREKLLPVLAEQAWPHLKKLALTGLALPGEGANSVEEAGDSDSKSSTATLHTFLGRLSSQDVDVELRAAGVMKFNYDATPLVVSPSGSWKAD